MPVVEEMIKRLTGKEPRKGVNPDEVVAAGAAIQAAVLTGEQKGLVLVDVTPLSLGVETQGGVMTVMIERNKRIPCDHTEVYTTGADFQSGVEIKVLQGERPMAQDNRALGLFQLDGIPPAPKGVPQIEVKFEVDVNGILNVTAKDRTSGKVTNVTISGSTTLSKSDIDRMVKEADVNADLDRKRRDLIDFRNQGERMASQLEAMLKEHGSSAPESIRNEAESALSNVRANLKTEDVESLRSGVNQLEEMLRRTGEAIYQASQGAGSATTETGSPDFGTHEEGETEAEEDE